MAASPELSLLVHARELVAASWTQYADARDANGADVDPFDSTAAAWSLLGALVAAYGQSVETDELQALAMLVAACNALANIVDDDDLQHWNDAHGRTQADVVRVLDEASHSDAAPPPELTFWLN